MGNKKVFVSVYEDTDDNVEVKHSITNVTVVDAIKFLQLFK